MISVFLLLLFSYYQVVIKNSSNDDFYGSKKRFERYHFERTRFLFDDFIMSTSEQENERKRKKKSQIPSPSLFESIEYSTGGPPLTRKSLI